MKLKIISWNVNGVRAIERKGELKNLLENHNPDLLFLQEIKAKKEQLSKWLTDHNAYEQIYHSAEKAGYSGVGLWIQKDKFKKFEIDTGMQGWSDIEGRVISIKFEASNSKYEIYGIYFPNGGKSPQAWDEKLEFYDHFHNLIKEKRKSGVKILFTGDLNVAHNEIDLARPKENENNIGFRIKERNWVTRLVRDNWVDVFRNFFPEKISYTWWNMQTRSRERNVGWRIDYFIVDKSILKKVKSIEHLNDQMGSDHCPIVMEVEL